MKRTRLKDIPVLELNASFEPIRVTDAKRALTMLVNRKAMLVVEGDREVYPGFPMPSVIRLFEYAKVPYTRPRAHRKNILLRDGYRCQYCGELFPGKALTLDHITPKAQGGPTIWENLVAACHECNHAKADRTPEQAGMQLRQRIWPATVHSSRHLMRLRGENEPEWREYLFLGKNAA